MFPKIDYGLNVQGEDLNEKKLKLQLSEDFSRSTIAQMEGQLRNAQTMYDNAKNNPPLGIESARKAYEDARERGERRETVDRLHQLYEEAQRRYDDSLNHYQEQIRGLQAAIGEKRAAETRQLTEEAAAKESGMKAAALEAWLEQGGAPADFEAAWPEIKKQYLAQQAAEAIAAADPLASKRAQMRGEL